METVGVTCVIPALVTQVAVESPRVFRRLHYLTRGGSPPSRPSIVRASLAASYRHVAPVAAQPKDREPRGSCLQLPAV